MAELQNILRAVFVAGGALVFLYLAVKLATLAYYRGRQAAIDFQNRKEKQHE